VDAPANLVLAVLPALEASTFIMFADIVPELGNAIILFVF
jgi:hypothetical protein